MPAYKSNNTYYVRFYYTDHTGSRKQKTKRGFSRKKDALEWEREFLLKMTGSPQMSFESLRIDYMTGMKNRIRKTTFANKKHLIETKIAPFFDKHAIADIDALSIRKWQNWLMEQTTKDGKPFAPTYLKSINNQLSAIFNYAVKYYDLKSNPIHKTGSIGKKHADKMDFWTLDEFQNFAAHIEDKPHSKVMFTLLFWSGMRIGELVALTDLDFDYTKNTVNINKSFTRLDGEDIISDPKTYKSKRTVTLPEFVMESVTEYKETLYKIDPDDRLFPFTKHFVRHEMIRGSKLSGVKKIRVHDLRHSHASLLIELGFSPLVIMERLGHEEIETTLQTYSHLYPNKQQDVADKLQEIGLRPF